MIDLPCTPCLIIGFARFEGIARTLKVLSNSRVNRIFLALDGPNTPEQSLIQNRIIHHAREVCEANGITLNIWRRESNLGLAASVMSAIDWFFANVERGIILEDDLDFSSNFINYSSEALEFFKNDSDVWLVSGNNFFSDNNSTYLNSWTTYPLIWGWATWRDRWQEMRSLILSEVEPRNNNFTLSVSSFWRTGLRRSRVGKIDSWAAPLAAIQHSLGKYSVLPPINLVSNVGNDSVAVHTSASGWHMNQVFSTDIQVIRFQTSGKLAVSRSIDLKLEKVVYKISYRNTFSIILMLLFDEIRFPRKKRQLSLKRRLDSIQLPN